MFTSGGMPAVIIKMLVASEPGRIQFLPALPEAWPRGEIEGVLCRGQIEVKRLRWENRGVFVSLLSAKEQRVELEMPWEVANVSMTERRAPVERTDSKRAIRLALPAGQEVSLRIGRK